MILLVAALLTHHAAAAPVPTAPRELAPETRSCYAVWQGLSLSRRQGAKGGAWGMAEKGCQAHVGGGLIELTDVRLKVAVEGSDRDGKAGERMLFITSPTGLIARDHGRFPRDQIAVSSLAVVIVDGTPVKHNGLVVDFRAGEVRSSNGLRLKLL